MGHTVISSETVELPFRLIAPIVEWKETWEDEWELAPELEFLGASTASARHDLGRAEFRRSYGHVKEPWESTFTDRVAYDLSGWWVRVSLVGDEDNVVIWVGQFSNEGSDIHGSDAAASGSQTWTAYEPGLILRKTDVSLSYWSVGGSEKVIGWLPDMNGRDRHGTMIGNRSADKVGSVYLYGGTDVWNAADYLEYLLEKFLGDAWKIAGPSVAALEEIEEVIKFEEVTTAAEIVDKLIPTRLGLDYKVIVRENTFEIHVFSLSSQDFSFGGETVTANPDTVSFEVSEAIDLVKAREVTSTDQLYDRVRLVGKRIVVCCSARGSEATGISCPLTVEPKWTTTQETAYLAGTGTPADSAEDHDKARKRDELAGVFAIYGAPATLTLDKTLAPKLDPTGQTLLDEVADYQTQVRRTMNHLPLWEGYDYTTDPPTNGNPTGFVPDFLPPFAWVFVPDDPDADPDTGKYMPAHELHMGVEVPNNEWGFLLRAEPNHILALGHFSGAADSKTNPSYDYEKLVATIAFETDQRLILEHTRPEVDTDNPVVTKNVPIDAEVWLLAPKTVVGVDAAGAFVFSPDTTVVLRNDATRLAMAMSGAVARYATPRVGRSCTSVACCRGATWSEGY